MSRWYVGAYWGPRREPVEVCADRLARCLAGLAEADELLASWYLKGVSAETADVPVTAQASGLRETLLAGRSRSDFGGEVVEDLGFAIDFWSRQPGGAAADLSGTFGAYWSGRSVPNDLLLKLPAPERSAPDHLYDRAVAERVTAAVVEAWEPDWATFTSRTLRKAQHREGTEPVVGWATYLARHRLPSLPADAAAVPARWQELVGGRLIVLDTDPAGTTVDGVLAVRDVLQRAGALTPLLPTG